MKECSCGGANPDCFRCSGTGIVPETKSASYSSRTTATFRAVAKPRPHRICPMCKSPFRRLLRHLRDQHDIPVPIPVCSFTFVVDGATWYWCQFCGACGEGADSAHLQARHPGKNVD